VRNGSAWEEERHKSADGCRDVSRREDEISTSTNVNINLSSGGRRSRRDGCCCGSAGRSGRGTRRRGEVVLRRSQGKQWQERKGGGKFEHVERFWGIEDSAVCLDIGDIRGLVAANGERR